ncbi:helix-turn-helix domain-containing protein [Parvularcula maris]|uniref:AraC family transcriptional regulator n=1 Tax=Parvularcula maris TaxID=2965077 RepID=A0A9X2L7Z3_9PROT|nr:AraC family transcriptional regulator [Parvularcula maris]MCQ8184793.1 AraC family transcriptional regulator [Parvularcula maris]
MNEVPPIILCSAGIVVGALSLLIAALLRAKAGRAVTFWGVLFSASVIGLSLEDLLPPPYDHGAGLAATLMAGSFWPFTLYLFGTDRRREVVLGPMAVIMTVFVVGHLFPIHREAMLVHRFVMIAIGAMVVGLVWRSEEDDLDPVRRQIRRPLIGLIGVWVVFVSFLGALASFGLRPDAFLFVDEMGTAVIALIGTILFTAPRPGLFAAPRAAPPQPELKQHADTRLLEALRRAMEEDEAWREEGLTVGALAEKLGTQEHHLRPLINRELGYRNFAAFINEHRLREAKRRLRAEEHASDTVASIAFACGFASLGPFGRAFKAAEGVTPSQYRRGAGRSSKKLTDFEEGGARSGIGETETSRPGSLQVDA